MFNDESVETPGSINNWALQTFGPDGSDMVVAARANEEMAELIRAIASGKSKEDIAEEAADVIIVLCRIFNRCDTTMWSAIDRKMSINRKRKWKKLDDGTGYHIREEK